MASRWPAPDLAYTFQRRRRTDQWGATQGTDFLFLALEKTHGQHEVNVGRAKMFHVLKRCQRLLSPVFTGTVSPALTRLEPRASRHSPTWRRSFAPNVSPCQRRWRANSSHPVTTRRFSEERRESGDQDGDAAAVQGETMDIDRRSESQGSAMGSHWPLPLALRVAGEGRQTAIHTNAHIYRQFRGKAFHTHDNSMCFT